MSSRFSLSPLLIGVVLLAGIVVYLNMPEEQSANKGGPRATPVNTAMVSSQAFPITIESLGTAIANESVNITAQVTDTVKALHFEDGDEVKYYYFAVEGLEKGSIIEECSYKKYGSNYYGTKVYFQGSEARFNQTFSITDFLQCTLNLYKNHTRSSMN